MTPMPNQYKTLILIDTAVTTNPRDVKFIGYIIRQQHGLTLDQTVVHTNVTAAKDPTGTMTAGFNRIVFLTHTDPERTSTEYIKSAFGHYKGNPNATYHFGVHDVTSINAPDIMIGNKEMADDIFRGIESKIFSPHGDIVTDQNVLVVIDSALPDMSTYMKDLYVECASSLIEQSTSIQLTNQQCCIRFIMAEDFNHIVHGRDRNTSAGMCAAACTSR